MGKDIDLVSAHACGNYIVRDGKFLKGQCDYEEEFHSLPVNDIDQVIM